MAVFKTRKVDRPANATSSKAPWGARAHRIEGRDVGVRVDRDGKVRDTVSWAMPADFDYTDGNPCKVAVGRQSKTERGKCWIQLTFQQGRPHLRVCKKSNAKGALIPVNSPTEARELGRKLCDDFEAAKGDWKKFEKTLPKNYKLGAAAPKPRARKAKSGSKAKGKSKHCVIGRRGKTLRCFTTKKAADSYRKKRCGKLKKCSLKVKAA